MGKTAETLDTKEVVMGRSPLLRKDSWALEMPSLLASALSDRPSWACAVDSCPRKSLCPVLTKCSVFVNSPNVGVAGFEPATT